MNDNVTPLFPDLSNTTEKAFQDLVTKIARGHGWKVWHHPDSRRTEPGWPDLAFLRPPHFFLAELKTTKGKISSSQAVTIQGLRNSNIEVHIWRPGNIGEIYRRLTKGKTNDIKETQND